MFKSIIITVSVFWTSSLADLRLTCYPLTPTCPGTVVHCQCDGAIGSLTWRISSEGSSCTIGYDAINRDIDDVTPVGDCSAVTVQDVSSLIVGNQFRFNSSLSINLNSTERVVISCKNTQRNITIASMPNYFKLSLASVFCLQAHLLPRLT